MRKLLTGFTLCAVSLLVAGCVSQKSAIRANPDSANAAASQPVILENKPADSIRAADVINRSRTSVTRTGEIYMMRGLANVFSRGIDEMARELRSRGYDASNFSYTEWRPIAEDIIRRNASRKVSYPVVIVGHSLGGNESSKFANRLAAGGVNVSLIVTFDPVETGKVGSGIGRVVNYYLPKEADNRIVPVDGFNGKINNVDVTSDPAITHTNVDKHRPFQTATYNSIANMTKKTRAQQVRKTGPGR